MSHVTRNASNDDTPGAGLGIKTPERSDSISSQVYSSQLPIINDASGRLRTAGPITATTPPPPTPRSLPALSINTTELSREELLLKSMKKTFESVPWRLEDEDFTPASSSTASWGSPVVTDGMYQSLEYPAVTPLRSRPRRSALNRSVSHSSRPAQGGATPPPAYSSNNELVLEKRLSHALDEIKDLQRQLTSFKEELIVSKTSLQNELTDLKAIVDSVLRKEIRQGHNVEDQPVSPSVPLAKDSWQSSPVRKFGPPPSPWSKLHTNVTGSARLPLSPLIKELRFTPSPGINAVPLSPIHEISSPVHEIATPMTAFRDSPTPTTAISTRRVCLTAQYTTQANDDNIVSTTLTIPDDPEISNLTVDRSTSKSVLSFSSIQYHFKY